MVGHNHPYRRNSLHNILGIYCNYCLEMVIITSLKYFNRGKHVNILTQRARHWATPGRGKSALPPEGARKVVPMFFICRTGLSVLDGSLSVPDTLHIFGSYPNLSLLYQRNNLVTKNCYPSMACSLTF